MSYKNILGHISVSGHFFSIDTKQPFINLLFTYFDKLQKVIGNTHNDYIKT